MERAASSRLIGQRVVGKKISKAPGPYCPTLFPMLRKSKRWTGYQASSLVDNSQGHSAYAVDALLASGMNESDLVESKHDCEMAGT